MSNKNHINSLKSSKPACNDGDKAMRKRNSVSNNRPANVEPLAAPSIGMANEQLAALLQNPAFAAIANAIKVQSNANIDTMAKAEPAPKAKGRRASAAESTESAKAPKAPRQYETPFLTGCFKKRLVASPCNDAAAEYYSECAALCEDVIKTLGEYKDPAAILPHIKAIFNKVDKDANYDAAAALKALLSEWEITPQAFRVVIQLSIPVITPCCAELDDIARRFYGMSRANALMGSACNTLMYSKAAEGVEFPLPFKRPCYNTSALGLNWSECDCIDDCNFIKDDKDFDELCKICNHWLHTIKKREPAKPAAESAKPAAESAKPAAEPAKPASESKTRRRAAKSAPKAEPAKPAAAPQNDIASLLAEIANQLGIK